MIYTNNSFSGHWPVGSAAVVIADNQEQAAHYLMAQLESIGLKQEVKPEDMIEMKMQHSVRVLCDGDY